MFWLGLVLGCFIGCGAAVIGLIFWVRNDYDDDSISEAEWRRRMR